MDIDVVQNLIQTLKVSILYHVELVAIIDVGSCNVLVYFGQITELTHATEMETKEHLAVFISVIKEIKISTQDDIIDLKVVIIIIKEKRA